MSSEFRFESTKLTFDAAKLELDGLKKILTQMKSPETSFNVSDVKERQQRLRSCLVRLEVDLQGKEMRKRLAVRRRRWKKRHCRQTDGAELVDSTEDPVVIDEHFDDNSTLLECRMTKLGTEVSRLDKLLELRQLRKRLGKADCTSVDDELFEAKFNELRGSLQAELDSCQTQLDQIQSATERRKVAEIDAYKSAVTKLLFGDKIAPLNRDQLEQNRAAWESYRCSPGTAMSSQLPSGWILPQFTTEEWLESVE